MIKENDAFMTFSEDTDGLLFDDAEHPIHPIRYYNVANLKPFKSQEDTSVQVYVYSGDFFIQREDQMPVPLSKGMYYSLAEPHELLPVSGDSKAIVIEVLHNKGVYPDTKFSSMFTMGGPIETTGRLKYIDGCTDSLLIPPVKMGDPCLNHLHFPSGIIQTAHTHNSHRIGVVARGTGKCVTPFGELPLKAGVIFIIKEWDGETRKAGLDGKDYEVGNHCFHTFGETMDVIAFHPESDFGPEDQDHPMINRTFVDGISAKDIESIKTA